MDIAHEKLSSGLVNAKNQITLSAEVASLPLGRAFIEKACRQVGIEDESCYDLQLAVDEALSNIIEHGYAGLEPGEIILRWQFNSQKLTITVMDYGHAFTPEEPERPDVEAIFQSGKQGGLGLFLIYHIMDRVSYRTTTEGNILTLTKKF